MARTRNAGETIPRPPVSPPPKPSGSSAWFWAGLAISAALGLAFVIVLASWTARHGSSKASSGPTVAVDQTPAPTAVSITARAKDNADILDAPSTDGSPLGELVPGQSVDIVGRDSKNQWFAIHYPPGSTLTGWVKQASVSFGGSAASLPLVGVTPLPQAAVPTAVPRPTSVASAPSVASTESPGVGTSLSVLLVTCQAGQPLTLKLQNNGPLALLPHPITVLIESATGQQLNLLATQPLALAVGQAIDIDTRFVVRQPVRVVIDPLQSLGGTAIAGNPLQCGAGQPATPPNIRVPTVVTVPTAAVPVATPPR